eukprot:1143983-Pelagomonas_calceolata.AAC.1
MEVTVRMECAHGGSRSGCFGSSLQLCSCTPVPVMESNPKQRWMLSALTKKTVSYASQQPRSCCAASIALIISTGSASQRALSA